MRGPINVKSPNNISKWQMGFNSAFKGLTENFIYLKLSGNLQLIYSAATFSNFVFRTKRLFMYVEVFRIKAHYFSNQPSVTAR
jgi:hypothetical protein